MQILKKIILGLTCLSFLFILLFWLINCSSSYILKFVNLYVLHIALILAGWAFLLNIIYSLCIKPKGWIWSSLLRLGYIFILGCILLYALITMHDNTRLALNWKGDAEQVYNYLREYLLKNKNILPDANSWSDQLIATAKDVRSLQWCFQKQKENDFAKLAFNKYLSNQDFNLLNGKLVLLFDSNSTGNANGTQESLEQFALKNNGHIFILFVDGNFADYDIKNHSLRFLQLGLKEKDYLPLKWKPEN
jgi:hypothetical protein